MNKNTGLLQALAVLSALIYSSNNVYDIFKVMSKLIIIRGNSGSGKTTIAKTIHDQVTPSTVLIESDYIRCVMLKEEEHLNALTAEFIAKIVESARQNGRHVILEGILYKDEYGALFDELISAHPDENYFFYLNVSLDKTLQRDKTKVGKDFKESDMRSWYRKKDVLGYENETVIDGNAAESSIVNHIMIASGLTA